jgi:isoquinoline 1-oxidoreductase beta subunit
METTPELAVSRRDFLKTSAVAVGGWVVAFHVPAFARKAFAAGGPPAMPLKPNAFVHIAPDNTITLIINKLEMGQGVNTSLAQLIAEELECDWTKIRSVSAPVDPAYNHTVFGMQMTGGSSALASSWDQHRRIGAAMRETLKLAAARKWGVPVSELTALDGPVRHRAHGQLSYGELADAAAKLEMPADILKDVALKDAKSFKVIGQSMKRVDAADKSNGKAVFGMDVRLPGMLYASVERPPVPGATLVSVGDAAARKVPGVVRVVKLDDRVAVLATNSHAARMGREELKLKWNLHGGDKFSDASLADGLRKQAAKPGLSVKKTGDAQQGLASAKTRFTADFEFPHLAHAPMEPMNCTIDFDGHKASLWGGFQMPTMERTVAAKILGIAPEKVEINTTYAGGSFGRRACKASDYVTEAARFAKVVKKPLKIVWTREDDMRGGYYRPMNFHRVSWGLTEDKKLAGWEHHIVGNTVIGGSPFEAMMVKNGIESTVTEGVSDTLYEIPNFSCEQTRVKTPVTTLWWRSVGHTHTAFVMESVIDEVAEAMGEDPLKVRRRHLAKAPRHLAVLDELEKLSGWGRKKPPEGRAWGLAIHESFNSVVGNVVEVSVEKAGAMAGAMAGGASRVRVHRVWSAVHCGQVVNPEGAKSQVESSVAFGISAALFQKITLEHGRVTSGNFIDYRVLRINEMPQVEVAFVASTEPPTGLGEPGLPPVAPAIASALYRLTGKRVRKLPLGPEAFA